MVHFDYFCRVCSTLPSLIFWSPPYLKADLSIISDGLWPMDLEVTATYDYLYSFGDDSGSSPSFNHAQ